MGIWNNKQIKDTLELLDYPTLEEGDTQVEEIKDRGTKLIIKREDKNPTGSWKDRGTAYKIAVLMRDNIKEAVLASSGNAAISFLTYANKYNNLKLRIVVSNNITDEKFKIIESLKNNIHEIYKVDNISKTAVELSAKYNIPNLKASTDDDYLIGYYSLGIELSKHFKNSKNNNSAIFIPTSSGTGLIGTVQGLQIGLDGSDNLPRIYAVQTQRVSPLLNQIDPQSLNKDSSLADAIIDTRMLRNLQVLKVIRETNGGSLAIKDEELLFSQSFLQRFNIENASFNSLLSLSGYMRLRNLSFEKAICIFSGR